jgi:heat shock protein HtpX
MFSRGDEEEAQEPSGVGSWIFAFVAPIAATLVKLGISRSREFLADETGAELSGDPTALADALLKLERAAQVVPSSAAQPATASLFIVNPLAARGSSFRMLFSTHPPVEARVDRLMTMASHRPTSRRRRALLTL